MDNAELVKSIAQWVTRNAEAESIFLTPRPRHLVSAHRLLDHVSDVTGISREQIGEWCATAGDWREQ